MFATCLGFAFGNYLLRLRMIHSRKISLETLGLILLTLKFDWSP